jgi:hypothetical protein
MLVAITGTEPRTLTVTIKNKPVLFVITNDLMRIRASFWAIEYNLENTNIARHAQFTVRIHLLPDDCTSVG